MTNHYHKNDLPQGLDFGDCIAIDTETMGLSLVRDALCIVQISDGNGDAHVIQLDRNTYDCPNLKAILADENIEKLFHFARFDVAMIKKYLNIEIKNIFCTKIASKLCRTYTDRHGLKDLLRELAGVELNKQQQSSDWGQDNLSEAQIAYAASDVLYLHSARAKLIEMLLRCDRMELAKSCFNFLPSQAILDINGFGDLDIFAH